MKRLAWFKHEPERTATGYRWLDLLADPYWRLSAWWTERKFWKVMRVGDDSIGETKVWVREALRDIAELRRIEDQPESLVVRCSGPGTLCAVHGMKHRGEDDD